MASDRDDRWGDDEPRDDDYRRPAPLQSARSKVAAPAISLIVVGVLTLIYICYSLAIEYPKMDAGFDEQLKQIDDNPQFKDQEKKAQKDMINAMRGPMKTAMLPAYAFMAGGAFLIIFGGIKMKWLSGRGLAMTASILAMIPCFSGLVCVLGIPIGIWSLSVLSNPDVKAAFASGRSRGPQGDDDGWGERDRP